MNLFERMKKYERCVGSYCTPNMPIIIRVDGRAFHTFTRKYGCEKPFDTKLSESMVYAASTLCSEIQGAFFGYVQSDEISIVAHDLTSFDTEHWFGGKVQKIASVSSSIASVSFNKCFNTYLNSSIFPLATATFDSRVFSIPENEIVNYFICRQQDWIRNSLQMVARSYFSHNELNGIKGPGLHEKLFSEKGVNWANLPTKWKNGIAVIKEGNGWRPDFETPKFSDNKEYVLRSFLQESVDTGI
jgi:tRNA(His) guanylyltransferase